jgi:hypothetical protein
VRSIRLRKNRTRGNAPSDVESPEKKQQVPPLRYAPVGMTILWDHEQPFV